MEYDDNFTDRFVDQLETVPEGSELSEFILDSAALRQAVRACQGV